jgi:hypothetical protein
MFADITTFENSMVRFTETLKEIDPTAATTTLRAAQEVLKLCCTSPEKDLVLMFLLRTIGRSNGKAVPNQPSTP